jgi:hypothetical protein
MGKSSGGTQTVVNKTELPQWVQDAAQRNLNQAYSVADNLMGPYTGQRVANMTPGQLADINTVQGAVGMSQPAYNFATGAAANVANYTPTQVTPGSLATTNLDPYMNPFTNNVVNSALKNLDITRQRGLNQIGDQAVRTGAFGGSRQGVAEGVLNSEAARQAGDLTANLQSQNFAQAQNAATNDINRNLNAQITNQQAGLTGAGINLAGANAVGNLAGQGQNSFLTGAAAALAGQDAIQQNQQAQLAAAQQAYQEQQDFPIKKLQIPLQALGATPYGSSSTQNTTMSGGDPWMGILGGASTGVGILGGLKYLGMFSDENEKTDIKKLGKDPASGLDMYAYRYKGDPKSYPKVVGPMAQDIEKKYPGSTKKVGGKMVVSNLGFGRA